jgi:hypothetical protein
MNADEVTVFAPIIDLNSGFATLFNDFERPTIPWVKQT